MSNTIFACAPRAARPITSLACSSRQARRQRVHWMQASRLTRWPGATGRPPPPAAPGSAACPRPAARPGVDLVVLRVRGRGQVGLQQFEHQALRLQRTLAGGLHLHAGGDRAAARRRQRALAGHFHHAGAAVAGRRQAGLVAQVRDGDALALRHLEDRLAGRGLHRAAVEREVQRRRSRCQFVAESGASRSPPGSAPPGPGRRSTRRASPGSGRPAAAGPSGRAAISAEALAVPLRQGVHWPQLSCSKKRIRLRAASSTESCCDSTITAAEPMKQPCGCSVSKSSGTSASRAGRMPPEAPPAGRPRACGPAACRRRIRRPARAA
jgi:hypothetical protein